VSARAHRTVLLALALMPSRLSRIPVGSPQLRDAHVHVAELSHRPPFHAQPPTAHVPMHRLSIHKGQSKVPSARPFYSPYLGLLLTQPYYRIVCCCPQTR
jgi:hypothetical protein